MIVDHSGALGVLMTEALACGTPVVATPCPRGRCRRHVADRFSGRVVERPDERVMENLVGRGSGRLALAPGARQGRALAW